MTGKKASLALELTPERFTATQYADDPAAELMYLSWEYVCRAGPESGVRVSQYLRGLAVLTDSTDRSSRLGLGDRLKS